MMLSVATDLMLQKHNNQFAKNKHKQEKRKKEEKKEQEQQEDLIYIKTNNI